MLEILFAQMELAEDGVTVRIHGDYDNEKIIIELSVLQFAKICQLDKEVVERAQQEFGSHALELACEETKKAIGQFTQIEYEELFVFEKSELLEESITENHNPTISLCAEDLQGWDNEGVVVTLPLDIYEEHIEGLTFAVAMSSKKLVIKTQE